MDNEQFYDEQIAPKLLELAKLCDEQGVGFAAYVEYEPDDVAATVNITARKSENLMRSRHALLNPSPMLAMTITTPGGEHG